MQNLQTVLNKDGARQAVIDDSVTLVQEEVNRKKGISGFAIKNGYKVVSKLKGGYMTHIMVDKMLDQFVSSLEPFYAQYQAAGNGSFAAFLAEREDAVAEALLAATDQRRQAESNKMLTGAYDKLRPMAKRNVQEAVPGIGRMIENHL